MIGFERLKAQEQGHYTVWLTTSEVDQVKRLGVLDCERLGQRPGRVEQVSRGPHAGARRRSGGDEVERPDRVARHVPQRL